MEITTVQTAVIGAGVVGLAIGAELARTGDKVLVLESAKGIGSGISSRGSHVIHSGIYYPEEQLKCQLCIEGRHLLYSYCDTHKIAYRKCGKLVVATCDVEVPKVETIARQAQRNGIENSKLIEGRELRRLEGELAAIAALYVPDTGIIDAYAYMSVLAGEIKNAGGTFLCEHTVISGSCGSHHFEIEVDSPFGSMRVNAKRLVLAAGLRSHELAKRLEGYEFAAVPPLTLAKGSYFSYFGAAPFVHLIYPVPDDGGLGIHLTFDLKGNVRFGPDVEWLDTSDPQQINFAVDESRSCSYFESIKRYWPGLPEASLSPAYSGVRPKLSRHGEPAADFLIHGPKEHGIPNFVSLYGIESPGLTSSLALARYVARLLN